MTSTLPMADPTAVMGRRIGAYLIDTIIGLVLLVVLLVPFASSIADESSFSSDTQASDYCSTINDSTFDTESDGNTTSTTFNGNDPLCVPIGSSAYVVTAEDINSVAVKLQLFSFLVNGLNLLVLQGLTGASIGKFATGIRVVRHDGRTVGFGWNLLRWLLLIVDSFCCALIGLITAFTSKGHRRVGDMAASTLVVRKDAVGSPINVPGLTAPVSPPYGSGGYPGYPQAPGATWGAPPTGQTGTWAPTGPAAPPAPGAVPTGEGPTWDAARNAYIQYDRDQGAWVQWDDATKAWGPISQ